MKRLIKKIYLIYRIATRNSLKEAFTLPFEAEARLIIRKCLQKRIQPKDASQSIQVANMADEIWSNLQVPAKLPIEARSKKMLADITSDAFWFHSQIAGLTAIWEFKIRFFANKLGIRSNEEVLKKAKRFRNSKTVQHRVLSDVIKSINSKTNNRLQLKLLELSDLRNAVVHCNPQAMRTAGLPLLGKQAFSKLKGNVYSINLSAKTMSKISDLKKEEEIEEVDLLGFLLETYSSKVPSKTLTLFEESIIKLDKLILLSAYSFEGSEGLFNDVLIAGEWPEEKIIAFQEHCKQNGFSDSQTNDLLTSIRATVRLK